jgi:predicted branched-subunit amino acid permease
MNIQYKIFSKGCLDVIPLLIPVVPFGVIFGVIGIESGLGSTVTFLMSIIIFAGSSQLAFVQLFTGGATTPVIVSSVAIVNSRHFLYSAVIAQYLTKVKLFWKIVLSYFLTDQAFIVSQKYFKQQPTNKDRHYHLLGSGFTLVVCVATFYYCWNCFRRIYTKRIKFSICGTFNFYFFNYCRY